MDLQELRFLHIVNETWDAVLFQTTLNWAVWIPKKVIDDVDDRLGIVTISDSFSIGNSDKAWVRVSGSKRANFYIDE